MLETRVDRTRVKNFLKKVTAHMPQQWCLTPFKDAWKIQGGVRADANLVIATNKLRQDFSFL